MCRGCSFAASDASDGNGGDGCGERGSLGKRGVLESGSGEGVLGIKAGIGPMSGERGGVGILGCPSTRAT